jgi:hypothetical protein
MTIPPVSERAFRPCCNYSDDIRCIFFESSEFGVSCNLGIGERIGEFGDDLARPLGCKSNFTQEEIWEVIDHHNQQNESCTDRQ